MQFKTLLAALRARGLSEKADYYEQKVTAHFMQCAPAEFQSNPLFTLILKNILAELSVDELAATLTQAPTQAENYIESLRARGYRISERYLKCRQY
jgi:biotin operon repressor